MSKEIDIGENKQFIEDLLLRIFEKILIMSYPLRLQRKKNKKDGDMQYLAIYFVFVLLNRTISLQKLTYLWNELLVNPGLYNPNTLIHDMMQEEDFVEWIQKFTFTIDHEADISNRLAQILKPRYLSSTLFKNKISAGSERILSRFITSIEVMKIEEPSEKQKKISELDYIIYILFFNLLKKHINERRGNTQKQVFDSINKTFSDGFDFKSFSKNIPLEVIKKNKLLKEILGKKDIIFEIADFIFNISDSIKNEVISDIIGKNKLFFSKELSIAPETIRKKKKIG